MNVLSKAFPAFQTKWWDQHLAFGMEWDEQVSGSQHTPNICPKGLWAFMSQATTSDAAGKVGRGVRAQGRKRQRNLLPEPAS